MGGILLNNALKLYRKRFIPNEIIHLKDDKILVHSNDLIITKWDTLKPRKDIDHGISAFFIDKGIKVSKIFDKDNRVVYWYCDIINTIVDNHDSSIIFEDLLIDVIVYEDGFVKVVDTGEVADALEQSLITQDIAVKALHILDSLLCIIYSGNFSELQNVINEVESYQ